MNILTRHLEEFTRILSELWRQTSSNAIRRKESQPTASLRLPNSFHRSNTFLLFKLFNKLLFPGFICSSVVCIFGIYFTIIFYPFVFPSQQGAPLDYHAPIGWLSSFPHPHRLKSPPFSCKTHEGIKSQQLNSGFSAGLYVTIKTHPCIILC